ncbi:hypothetical protein CDL15_Pgr007348 [Punica granatum]|uniref:Uncharacterized protein n=1 Tax=Punica granatum TaxID=22663 RepID=A0A218X9B6_PUNGR|nr:hypothetical protein CDL15_Pgr007348 [Punica granatum]PKI67751.1 hypothetical protein CRG98_011964 [Punica granatum]
MSNRWSYCLCSILVVLLVVCTKLGISKAEHREQEIHYHQRSLWKKPVKEDQCIIRTDSKQSLTRIIDDIKKYKMELDAMCGKGEKAQNEFKSSAELWMSEKQAKAEELAERLNESGDSNLLKKSGKLEGELIISEQNAVQQRRQTWPQPQRTSEILSVSRSLKSSRREKWKNVTKEVAHGTAYSWVPFGLPCGGFLDSSMKNGLFKMATFDPNGGGEGSSGSSINSSEGQKGSSSTGTQEGGSKGRRPGKSLWKQWCCFGNENEDDR